MEILLIIRFCCNCTYGNPGSLSREGGAFHHEGLTPVGLNVGLKIWGATKKGGGQVTGYTAPTS